MPTCGGGAQTATTERETGQALILVAVALPMFFSVALLVVDG